MIRRASLKRLSTELHAKEIMNVYDKYYLSKTSDFSTRIPEADKAGTGGGEMLRNGDPANAGSEGGG